MQVIATSVGIVVRLDIGEEIITALTGYIAESNIGGGMISGIGTVKGVVLGYYNLAQQTYQKKHFSQELELVGFNGNISWFEDRPIIHVHVSVSGSDFKTYSGHLFSAEITGTGEFFILPTTFKIHRAPDPSTGLNVIDH